MKAKFVTGLLTLFIFCFDNSHAYGWGGYGHQHIIRASIMALPPEIGMFYYNHMDFLTEESVVPDLRKYTILDKAEFPRHYIDLEAYNYTGVASMPQNMKEAETRYNKDTLQKYGILPWYLQDMMGKLTKAFKNKNRAEILFLSGDLSHYIADAHMPLHTSLNHDGQLTGQAGIHAFWESQLPELFGDNYNFYTGEVHYIDNINETIWKIVTHSFSLADTMLAKERNLKKDYPQDQVYKKDASGNIILNKFKQPVHSNEYAAKYHEMLNGMVEAQMRAAIKMTADFWYTAWVNAGKPELKELDPAIVTERNEKFYPIDVKEWKSGKVNGLTSGGEFK